MTKQIKLTKDKDCKGSVRFSSKDDQAVVSSVYVNRIFPEINFAEEVLVTIEITRSKKV